MEEQLVRLQSMMLSRMVQGFYLQRNERVTGIVIGAVLW